MKSPDLVEEVAAGDEGPEDDVAQVRVDVQDLTQGIVRDLEDVALAPGDAAEDRRAPGQLGHLAGELPGPEGRDDLRLIAGVVDDLDLAGLDDVEVAVALRRLRRASPRRDNA